MVVGSINKNKNLNKPAPLRMMPNWTIWHQRPKCQLGKAVALSLNINPSALSWLKENDKRKYGIYISRLTTSSLEAYQGGRIEIFQDHPDDKKTSKTRIVSLASFVSFAMKQDTWLEKLPAEFIMLKESAERRVSDQQGNVVDKNADENPMDGMVKRKAPDKFVAALIKFLVEIAKRAEHDAIQFDVTKMPGVKEDLRAVAIKYDPELDKTKRTFDDYLAYLCQFKRGARSCDFYSKLFPEYILASS